MLCARSDKEILFLLLLLVRWRSSKYGDDCVWLKLTLRNIFDLSAVIDVFGSLCFFSSVIRKTTAKTLILFDKHSTMDFLFGLNIEVLCWVISRGFTSMNTLLEHLDETFQCRRLILPLLSILNGWNPNWVNLLCAITLTHQIYQINRIGFFLY